jgi:hypothetical protein
MGTVCMVATMRRDGVPWQLGKLARGPSDRKMECIVYIDICGKVIVSPSYKAPQVKSCHLYYSLLYFDGQSRESSILTARQAPQFCRGWRITTSIK